MKNMNTVTNVKNKKDVGEVAAKMATIKKTVASAIVEEKKEAKLGQEVKVDMETMKPAKEKKVVEKKVVEKKASVKKSAETKEPNKAMKDINEEIFVQFGNSEIQMKEVMQKVKAAYVAEGHKEDSIEKIRVYLKPEENMVYYVVNDGYASGISLF